MTRLQDLRRMLNRREVSAVELAQEYLNRIRRENDTLHAFLSLNEENALRQAENAQVLLDKNEGGVLCGIPACVKDNFCVRGQKTSCGSRMLSPFIPAYDADLVNGMIASGSVILGKTAMDEFAMGNSTQTCYPQGALNPLDPSRVPGGSSGGTASAVAAGMSVWGLGSDTGGSVTQPAAFCGITGFTPTWGTLSRYGLIAFASGLDQPGILCESPADCAVILSEITNYPSNDNTLSPHRITDWQIGKESRKPVLGLPKQIFDLPMEDAVRNEYERILPRLEKAGYTIREVSIPGIEDSVSLYQILTASQAYSNLGRYDGLRYGLKGEGNFEQSGAQVRSSGFGDEVQRRILMGSFALHDRREGNLYQRAVHGSQLLRAAFHEALKECDVILSPTSATIPFRPHTFDEHPTQAYLADICVTGCNVARLPSLNISFPAQVFPRMGLLLVTGAYEDAKLLDWGEGIYREVCL